MRILQVGKYYHPEKGGIETNLRCLSVGLSESATVEVVVSAKGNEGSVDNLDGISIERLPSPFHLAGAPICPKLVSRLRHADADVIHVHLPNPWAAIAYQLSKCEIPLVVTYHSDIVRQSHIEPLFRPILLRFLRRAAAIVCATQDVIDNSKTLENLVDRCVIIPYGIDLGQIVKAGSNEVAAVRGPYKTPIVLAVGRLVGYKGFEYLIRAMAVVDASLVIVGRGPLKTELLRIASECHVASRVTILDDVENVAPFYHAADIFVLPSISRNEAFGIVQVEAMAAGKPVVNTRLTSGVPWVSLHGVTGLTVAPASSSELANAINQLLNDQTLRLRYGRAAQMRAFSEFGLDAMLSRTMNLYGSISRQRDMKPAKRLSSQGALGD